MRQTILVVALCACFAGVASAHLCNDVFAQARDNLAVKVDIRDGQLRIGKEASFRVYLLNTMDRDIVEIFLDVESKEFSAKVAPSPDWKRYPYLKTATRGGRKEYFTVALERKPGVPDGKYTINLKLRSNQQNGTRTFKTIDLATAAGLYDLPRATAIQIDGKPEAAEWREAALCTNFSIYERAGKYYEYRDAADQGRFRLAADDKYVYCLLSFLGGKEATADEAAIHVAAGNDDKPVTVTIDRLSGKVKSDKGIDGIEVHPSADKQDIECRIPRALLGVAATKTFFVNFTRTIQSAGQKPVVTYWRGNRVSVNDPMVYAQFRIAE